MTYFVINCFYKDTFEGPNYKSIGYEFLSCTKLNITENHLGFDTCQDYGCILYFLGVSHLPN
jgi:hypothetical protein